MKYYFSLAMAGFAFQVALLCNNATAGAALDDATILAIFDQTNAMDIYTGRLGAKHGNTNAVRELGKMVATDHVAVQQMGRDLAKKLAILPTPPDNDSSVMDQAKAILLLQAKKGPEFDKTYLRHEIAFHQSVINAVKDTLLPAIHNSELRELIMKVLPGFEHHLAETKTVAKRMGIE